jgi:hypothetical protein
MGSLWCLSGNSVLYGPPPAVAARGGRVEDAGGGKDDQVAAEHKRGVKDMRLY